MIQIHQIHQILLYTHIAIGTVAIFVFWLPVIARKGSPLHIRAGRIYTYTMYTVAISALLMSVIVLLDPISVRFGAQNVDMERAFSVASQSRMFSLFLLMLSLLVLSGLRHGMLALKARRDPGALRQPAHVALIATLGLLGIAVGIVGISQRQMLLIVFAFISVSASFQMLREIRLPRLDPKQALIAHFNGLIGTGIGAYTALFAFGGSRFLSQLLSGQWQIIPWVAPAIIGTIAIRQLAKRYQGRTLA